jgi:hypothetical protein
MNYQSYRAGMEGLGGIRDAILSHKMRKRDEEQRRLENQMRQAMFELQKRSADASIAGAEREFGFKQDRAGVEDARYSDQTQYTRGRDQMADTRYTDQTTYSRGRDTMGDQRYEDEVTRRAGREFKDDTFRNMELGLRMQALKERGNVGGYLTEELDEEGNVIGTKRRVPIRGEGTRMGDQPRGDGAAAGPKDAKQLIEAVRTGKMTKQQAKEYAQKQGWN